MSSVHGVSNIILINLACYEAVLLDDAVIISAEGMRQHMLVESEGFQYQQVHVIARKCMTWDDNLSFTG